MRRRATALATAALVLGTSTAALAAPGKKPGQRLPKGMTVQTLTHSAHLVSIAANSPIRMKAVLAGASLTARATTEDMCKATYHCLVAINGDFFGPTDPAGPLVVNQRLLRSGVNTHDSLTITPNLSPSGVGGQLKAQLTVPRIGTLDVPVNTPPGAGMSVYTPISSKVTLTHGQVALVCRVEGRLAKVATLGSAGALAPIRIVRKGTFVTGNGNIALVASARSAPQLNAWWKIRSNGGTVTYPRKSLENAIGGFPQLIRGGQLTFDPANPPDDGLHKRTVVGGDAKGDLWMLVVDQPVHLTVPAQILLARGAQWAMNLDGGGSSTMATQHSLISRPNGPQRKVASALVVVLDPTAHSSSTKPVPVVVAPPAVAAAAAPKATPAPSPSPSPSPTPLIKLPPLKPASQSSAREVAPTPVVDLFAALLVALAATSFVRVARSRRHPWQASQRPNSEM